MDYYLTFMEGLLSFLSPCLLPLLPVYLSYFAAASSTAGKRKYTVFVNALCFIGGFSLIFILLGALSATFGRLVSAYLVYIRIFFGILLLLMGLNFTGIVVIPFLSRAGGRKYNTKKYGLGTSFLMGILFCAGWIPCVGAFLSAALIAAVNSRTVLHGILLLTVYCLGLGLPFLLSALLMDYLSKAIGFIKRHYNILNILSGILLIFLGLQMLYQSLSALL